MTKYRIKAPDGNTYMVDGPANATDEEVRAEVIKQHPDILRQIAPPPTTRAQAVAQGQPRSVLGYLGHLAGVAGRTTIEGLGNVAEYLNPINPAAVARNIYHDVAGGPREEDTSHLSEHATDISNRAGLDAPEGALENIASSGGKAAIAAALMGPRAALMEAPIAAGAVVPRLAVPTVAKALPAALRGAAVSGATSGAAGETVRQMGGGEFLQGAASLAGGFAPAALEAKGLAGATKSIFDKGHERAARLLQKSTTDTPGQVIGRLATAPRPSPGVKPLTGEIAGDTGLAALQRERMNTDISDQQTANQIARGGTLDRAGGTGNVADTVALGESEAAKEQARIQADLLKRQGEREAQIGVAKENISPVVDRAVSGEAGRNLLRGAEDTSQSGVTAAYQNPLVDAEVPLKVGSSFHADLTNSLQKWYGNAAGAVPARIKNILGDFLDWSTKARGGKLDTNSKVISNIDSQLADYAGELQMRGRGTAAGRAKGFANHLRSLFEQHTADQIPADVTSAQDIAAAARKQHGTLFEGSERNPVASVLSNDRFGNPLLGDVQVPGQLVTSGADGAHAASSLIAAVGHDASEPFVRQEVRRLIDEGKLHPDNVQNFMDTLKQYPQVLDRVNALQDIQRLGEVQALDNVFKDTPLHGITGEPLKANEYVSSLLTNGKTGEFEGLVKQVKDSGDPKAIAGLRRAIADHIQTSGTSTEVSALGKAIPSVQKSRDAVDLVLSRARDILTPEQVRVFEQIQNELKGTRFAETAGVPEKAEGLDTNIPGVQRAGGPTGTRTIRFILKHFSNQGKVDQLVVDALQNPKTAAELLKRPVPQRLANIKRSVRNSVTGTVAGFQQLQPQPTQ